ncbi:MAG: glycosyltransferase family 9 protein, partial [Candidatus Neomarinimicrobiota bacterium]
LAKEQYDLVLDLHNSLRSKIVRQYFRTAQLRVYRKPRLKRWLLFYLWLNRFAPDFSVVGEYLRYAGLSVPEAERSPRMAVPADTARETCKRFGLNHGYLACIPGAAWPQKSWLIERYIELFGQRLAGSYSQLVLLGGPQDSICDQIAASLSTEMVVNLKGRTTLEDALAILSNSRLVIGSDTGLVHAGEALGVPAVMILGPTSRETGARAHHPQTVVHEVALWCRPCSQNGRRRCYRREQHCLTGITVDQVAESILSLIGPA